MNKKTLIIIGILFIVLAGSVLAYIFIFKETPVRENVQSEIEKDGFVIELPEGWVEVEAVTGSSATAMNNKEQINNANAQKIGFRSYYSVIHDVSNGEKVNDYLQKIKDSLTQGFPGITLLNKESKAFDGSPIYYIEADLIQQEIDFKTLLAVHIKDNDIWIISFNTLKENWEAYQNSFYQVAENFKIK